MVANPENTLFIITMFHGNAGHLQKFDKYVKGLSDYVIKSRTSEQKFDCL